MTRFEIRHDRTTIGEHTLALGWETLSLKHFRQEPPSSIELENAIAAIEDELDRVRPPPATGNGELQTADAFIRDIAAMAGISPGPEMVMTLGAVEGVYQTLAGGRPYLPSGQGFAAALLILREVMQHLRFRSIVITTP